MKDKRIWLVTGISSGLGKAIAETVMVKGDYLIGTFRKEEEVEAFNRKYRGQGWGLLMDLSSPTSVQDVIDEVASKFQRVDVLVNNAGVGFLGAVEETSLIEARQLFDINFFGTMQLTQLVLPLMRAQRHGHIVQISSHGGLKAFAGFGLYNASKFALEGMSEALAQEIKPLGIHLTLVEPGPFRTNFAGENIRQASAVIEEYNETAGAFRSKILSVHNKQEGDPMKAAKAIFQLVNKDHPPLRMPLGKIAMQTIGMKIDSLIKDVENGRAIAEGAVYE